MLNKFLPYLFLSILVFSISSSLAMLEEHDPADVFEVRHGVRFTRPDHSTGAMRLHNEGLHGAGRTVAIIDVEFDPDLIRGLMAKGVIHPDATRPHNPFILTPGETYEHSSLSEDMPDFSWKLEEIKARKKYYEEIKKLPTTHGNAVMEAVHLMAPKATLFPIDLFTYMKRPVEHLEKDLKKVYGDDTTVNVFNHLLHHARVVAINAAVDRSVDVINLSMNITDLTEEVLQAFDHAALKGILINIAAGNSSSEAYTYRIGEYYDAEKEAVLLGDLPKIVKRLDGKGIVFSGSLKINELGKEMLSSFTHVPTTDMEDKFLLAPGEDLPFDGYRDPTRPARGTSFSTPIITGGCLLLMEYAQKIGGKWFPDDFIAVMQLSGREVVATDPFSELVKAHELAFLSEEDLREPWNMYDVFMFAITYRSLDLYRAPRLMDKIRRGPRSEDYSVIDTGKNVFL